MPATLTTPLPPWLATLPQEDGFYHISQPRRFAHDEDKYDEQYNNQPNLLVGKGVLAAVSGVGGLDTSGPALEVGCGTGLVSLGLAAHSPYPLTILTDPSPAFLRITRRKMEAANIDAGRTAFAVLTGEELHLLPEAELSMIVLRSTLHHVLDVEKFIADAARALRPGGVITFQEPCMEGYLLMGSLVRFLPVLAERTGTPLTDTQASWVKGFADTMKFYARRDLDETKAEDKHLFRVDELMAMGVRCDLSFEFLPNTTYDALAVRCDDAAPARDAFTHFFRQYARYCMSWDDSLMALFDTHLAPHARYIEEASAGASGPYLHGVFVGRKQGRHVTGR